MTKTLLLVALLLCGILSSSAANEEQPSSSSGTAVVDPAEVSSHYREILQQPLYREPVSADPHAQLRDWLSRWLSRLGQDFDHFGYGEQMPRFAALIMTVLAGASSLTLLYLLLKLIRRGGWDRSRAHQSSGSFVRPNLDLSVTDLEQALAQRDWRRAWRATWRHLLFLLERAQLAAPDRSRTNREYLAQVESLPAPTFTRLESMVADYDHVIYGERAIGETEWKSFHQLAEETAFSLNLNEKPVARREA